MSIEDFAWTGRALNSEAQIDCLKKQIEILSKSNYDKVKDFHLAFNMKVSDEPELEGNDAALRIKLITEEYKEVVEAIENGNIVEIAKELADLLVVTYGTAVSFGIDIDSVFDDVMASNMSKLNDGKPIYREDGKLLKGDAYSPPDLSWVKKQKP
jgi:predicted HAD superfamily Cof-like phosphohydrolase